MFLLTVTRHVAIGWPASKRPWRKPASNYNGCALLIQYSQLVYSWVQNRIKQ